MSDALDGTIGHRLDGALRKKAESSTTSGARSDGGQDGWLAIEAEVVRSTTEPANATDSVPADHKQVERKQH